MLGCRMSPGAGCPVLMSGCAGVRGTLEGTHSGATLFRELSSAMLRASTLPGNRAILEMPQATSDFVFGLVSERDSVLTWCGRGSGVSFHSRLESRPQNRLNLSFPSFKRGVSCSPQK